MGWGGGLDKDPFGGGEKEENERKDAFREEMNGCCLTSDYLQIFPYGRYLTHWGATVKEALKPIVVVVVGGGSVGGSAHTHTCGDNIITCCLLTDLEVKSIEWD